jgi:hypothetical protein
LVISGASPTATADARERWWKTPNSEEIPEVIPLDRPESEESIPRALLIDESPDADENMVVQAAHRKSQSAENRGGLFCRLLPSTTCSGCGKKLAVIEIAAKAGRCANCTFFQSAVLKNPKEEVIFSQGASYCGGLADYPAYAKNPGFIYIASDHVYYLDAIFNWRLRYEAVRSVELATFQMSGVRAVLAGVRAIMMQA